MNINDKSLTLNVYSVDDDGIPEEFDITNTNQPKQNCLSFKISLKESMQIDKLKIVTEGLFPKIEYTESLKEVWEGDFGYELVDDTVPDKPKIN